MIDIHSPIIDFYPATFELDMNGKKAEWEAIVKIPFIDEKRLLKCIKGNHDKNLIIARENRLTAEEKRRNARGHDWSFVFAGHLPPTQYPSPLPSVFPDLYMSFSHMTPFQTIPKDPSIGINHLCTQARTGKDMLPGFPSIYSIPFTASIGYHGVNVFNAESKNPSHIVSIQNIFEGETPESVAMVLIDQTVFSSYPFLTESRVKSVSDEYFIYTKRDLQGVVRIDKTPHSDQSVRNFAQSAEKCEKLYSKRFGVLIGNVEMVAKLEVLVGMQLLNDGSLVKEFKTISDSDTPIQLLVLGNYFDPRFANVPCPSITEEFPIGSPVFFLAPKLYGTICEVVPSQNAGRDTVSVRLTV
jgi:5'-3' exoribonuclease 1